MAYTYNPAAPDAMNLVNLFTDATMEYLKMRQDAKQGIVATPLYPESPIVLPDAEVVWYKKPIVILAGLAAVGVIIYVIAKRKRA